MKVIALSTTLLGLSLVAGCASLEERDQREDLHNALKSEMKDCGSDTRCMQKRASAQSRAPSSAPAESKPAPVTP